VCGGDALNLFEASELELLLCGNPSPHLDFESLRRGARYTDGFDNDSPAVLFMWTVLLEDFDDHERRLFLQFMSGRLVSFAINALAVTVGRQAACTDVCAVRV
jgi:hypothetical protein